MSNPGDPHLTNYPEPSHVSRDRLNLLCGRVSQSVLGSASGGTGTLIASTIKTAVEAFVLARGDVRCAIGQVAPAIEELGIREAHRHPDPSRIDRSFNLASVAVQRGLPLVVGDLVNKDCLLRLRQDLAAYLMNLHQLARAAFDRTTRMAAMSPETCLANLRAIAFRGAPPRDVDEMASIAGLDPDIKYVPVVAVRSALPGSLRRQPNTLVDKDGMQALVPDAWDLDSMAQVFQTQVVLGPASTLTKAHQGVVLTGSAATILRDGSVPDERAVVPSTDLLAELLVRGNPLLAELLVTKHLQSMELLPLKRRMALSELLLLSLERGLPVNRVARDIGLPSQTAHNRMKALREILGEKLDNPDERLELMVAVRYARHRWALESD